MPITYDDVVGRGLLPVLVVVLVDAEAGVGVVGGHEVGDAAARKAQSPADWNRKRRKGSISTR